MTPYQPIFASVSNLLFTMARGSINRVATLCRWAGCPMQGISFSSPEELALHVEKAHVDPCADHDLYICQWEGCKVYNITSYSFGWLQRHIKTHTKERPNKCLMNGCNMSFNSVDALEKHLARHFEHTSTPKKSAKGSPSKVPVGSSAHKDVVIVKETRCETSVPCVHVVSESKPGQDSIPVACGDPLQKLAPKKHSLKVKIPRKTLLSCSPYSKVPVAFNGAHFHSEVMDMRTMSVIRHTTNNMTQKNLVSSTTSITLTAKVIGERRRKEREESEALVRWIPQVVPDEWIYLSNLQAEKVVCFKELPSSQLSVLASKCFGFDKLHGRRSKRKP